MKKHLLLSALLAMAGTTVTKAVANQPDSLYLFSYSTSKNSHKNGLHFAWSADAKRWMRIGRDYGFVKSDYGDWGRNKRMFDPVLERRPGGMWVCSWNVKPDGDIVAHTESADLMLWKPQDYMSSKVKMGPDRNVTRQTIVFPDGEKAVGQIHRVERSVVNNLLAGYDRRQYRDRLNNEQMKDDAVRFAGLKDVEYTVTAQPSEGKAISPELFGVFFEDINYGADGGLYGELVQNRDFEYSESDHGREKNWNSTFAWTATGGASLAVATDRPVHANNSHYAVLTVADGSGLLVNAGYDGIPVVKGGKYIVSLFGRTPSGNGGRLRVELRSKDGAVVGSATLKAGGKDWKKATAEITSSADATDAVLAVVPEKAGDYHLDMISLFPKDTFKGRRNGLRRDLAEAIADLNPKFVRFPGGCASHGNGLDNIYRWKNTVGPLEQRKGMANIWRYHQSMGLGFYEYFQFCEDIGATPLPVLAAGVPCQNSSWGGDGQQGGLPLGEPMDTYIQDILDLIEWANGDKSTKWGRVRAEAGHPKPFGLKYLGIGNEDLISEVFKERFQLIYNAVREKHPEIQVVGTVGPFCEGSDYEYGWQFADELDVPIVDEHYYCPPGWFIHNQDFYDAYDRNKSKVYLGEYASHLPGRPNNIETALSVAIYLTAVERNADVVTLSSYAPLLARRRHTQWTPDMIYFDNAGVTLTTDYYVQRMFGQNAGSRYVPALAGSNSGRDDVNVRLGQSVVVDEATGDIIVKLVNLLPQEVKTTVDLGGMVEGTVSASLEVLKGSPADRRAVPQKSAVDVASTTAYTMPAYSLSVIRIPAQPQKK